MLFEILVVAGAGTMAFALRTFNNPVLFRLGTLGLVATSFLAGWLIAGSLAAKKHTPATSGSFPTTGPLWVGLLVGIILIVGGLTFLPGLALGPIADHLAMTSGQLF